MDGSTEYGEFDLDFQLPDFLEQLFDDSDDDLFRTIDLNQVNHLVPMPSSTAELRKMDENLAQAALDIPPPETPAGPRQETVQSSKRFKTVSDEELMKYHESHQSSSTKKNTQWGLNTLQGK